jgi:SAM-dependent methyltransferase
MTEASAKATHVATHIRCIACGSNDNRLFTEDDNRTIRRCSSCHLLFVFPQPTPEKLDAEFQSSYFRDKSANSDRLERDFEVGRRPVLAQIAKAIRRRKFSGNLLDVGCASGEIFEYFRDGNWRMCGVEPSRAAFQRAKARFAGDERMELFNGYLCELSPGRSWDVITILESLYYMPDPHRELSYCLRALKPDGLLVIAVPGPQYQRLRHTGLISNILHRRRCSLTHSHLFYFSKASLTDLLESAGFRTIQTIPLVSPDYGGRAGRWVRNSYVRVSRLVRAATLGRIDLSLHVLYVCCKATFTAG